MRLEPVQRIKRKYCIFIWLVQCMIQKSKPIIRDPKMLGYRKYYEKYITLSTKLWAFQLFEKLTRAD